MPDFTLTAVQNKVWVMESPIDMVEGEVAVFAVTVSHASNVSSPVTTAFLNGDAFTTGITGTDASEDGSNVITTKAFTPTVDIRGDYVLVFKYVNGSQTEYKKCLVRVSKQEDAV